VDAWIRAQYNGYLGQSIVAVPSSLRGPKGIRTLMYYGASVALPSHAIGPCY
jgi:hypothetical protein